MPLPNLSLKETAAFVVVMAGGGLLAWLKWVSDRASREAQHARAARTNAELLEEYALSSYRLMTEPIVDEYGRGPLILVELPGLPEGTPAGHDRCGRQLEHAYHGLRKRIEVENRRFKDDTAAEAEFMDVASDRLEQEGWHIAAEALRLAEGYRKRYKLVRHHLDGRTQRIEQEIRDRSRAAAKPAWWRFMARVHRAFAQRRLEREWPTVLKH
ncbi:hypothetical protein FX016_22910 [Cupriavidus gilardii]|nr:hypothetical protein FX016_22910 [Cupriavidus gilardii]